MVPVLLIADMQIAVDIDGALDAAKNLEEIADGLEDVAWVVGTPVKYSVYLEQGTRHMKPYPFMGPAVDTVMNSQADSIANAAPSIPALIRGIAYAIERQAKMYASDGVPPGPDEVTGNLKRSIEARRVA